MPRRVKAKRLQAREAAEDPAPPEGTAEHWARQGTDR